MRTMCQSLLCYPIHWVKGLVPLRVQTFSPKILLQVMHLLFMEVKKIIWPPTYREDKYLSHEWTNVPLETGFWMQNLKLFKWNLFAKRPGVEVPSFRRESLCCISAPRCGVCAPFEVRASDPGSPARTSSSPNVERCVGKARRERAALAQRGEGWGGLSENNVQRFWERHHFS